MGLSIFTLIHILISLAGIVSGLVVLGGWLAGKRCGTGFSAFFLVTTVTTSVTGFFFPFPRLHPGLRSGRNFSLHFGGCHFCPLCAPTLRWLE